MKNIFISYSRKDAINVADFRSVEKFRNFQILIDDEEISFDKPWKQNIKNKIEDSNGAILFISNNALNHNSPIRTLELPLIAKRFEDPEDDFYFFPVFLEEIDEKKLSKYSFTPEGKTEEVNFLEFFQLYDLSLRNQIINLPQRKKKNEFKILNVDISNVLEGKNLSPGRDMLNTLKKRRILISTIATLSLFSGLSLFSQTDAFAVFLLRTYEAVSPDDIRPEDQSATVKFIASQLDNFENLEEIAENENLLDSVDDINKINIVLDQQQEVVNFSSSQESSSQESSSQESSSQESSSQTSSENNTMTTQSTTTTLNTQEEDNLAPTFSEQLNASDITRGEVTVSWNANDNVRVTKYVLREGSFIIYEGTNNSKRVEGLVAGKTYTFSVDAYDEAGNVSSSNVNFTTNESTVTTTTIPENTTTSTSTTSTTTTSTTTTSTTIAASYGTPTIYKVTVSGSTITAYYNDATTNTGLDIVGHGCQYSTVDGGPSGGTSTSSYSSSCSLDFPASYTTVSIKVMQQFGTFVSCGDGCSSFENTQWTEYSTPVTVYLTGDGSISDSSVEFVWDIPDIGPGCYPDTYPKNRQVNNVLLPFTETDVRQSLLDYGNGYGRLCGDDLVDAYVNHWKSKTADDIKSLYPSWSDNQLNTYLNGSGSGNSWDTGWYTNWNSTPLTTTTTTTTTASCVGITFPAPPDNELYIFGTLDVSNCEVLTTGFQCAQNCVGLVNQTAGGKTQAYFWAENNSASWLGNWTGYYQPGSGKFYVTSSGQGGGFEFTPPYQGP